MRFRVITSFRIFSAQRQSSNLQCDTIMGDEYNSEKDNMEQFYSCFDLLRIILPITSNIER